MTITQIKISKLSRDWGKTPTTYLLWLWKKYFL